MDRSWTLLGSASAARRRTISSCCAASRDTQKARCDLTYAALSPTSGTTLTVWLTNNPAAPLATSAPTATDSGK